MEVTGFVSNIIQLFNATLFYSIVVGYLNVGYLGSGRQASLLSLWLQPTCYESWYIEVSKIPVTIKPHNGDTFQKDKLLKLSYGTFWLI